MSLITIYCCDVCKKEKSVFDIYHQYDGWHDAEIKRDNTQICPSCLAKRLHVFDDIHSGCLATINFHVDVSHRLFEEET